MRNYPTAPSPQGSYPIVGQTDAERASGLLSKIHWPNFMKTSALIEGAAVVGAVAVKEPAVAALGGVAIALIGGGTLHDTHNYYRNGYRPNFPTNKFIKAKENEAHSPSSSR